MARVQRILVDFSLDRTPTMSFQARLPLQIEHTCNLRLVPESDVACGDAQVFCRLCTNCHPPFGSVLVDLFNRLQASCSWLVG
eukprot:1616033-Rhodomonas_salina.3